MLDFAVLWNHLSRGATTVHEAVPFHFFPAPMPGEPVNHRAIRFHFPHRMAVQVEKLAERNVHTYPLSASSEFDHYVYRIIVHRIWTFLEIAY